MDDRNYCTFYIIRHGQTERNLKKYQENPTYFFPHDSYVILESDGVEFNVKDVKKINI